MSNNSNIARKDDNTTHHPLPPEYLESFMSSQNEFLEVQKYLLDKLAKTFDSAEEEIKFASLVAASLAERHDYNRAIHHLIEVSEKFPDNCSLYVKMADYLSQAGEYDDACAALREATRREPNNVNYWLIATRLFLKSDQYKGAHSCLEKVFELQPHGLTGKRLLAELYAEVEQDEQADLIYEDIASTGLDDPDADLAKAKLRFKQGKRDEAELLYESRFSVSDHHPDTYPQFDPKSTWEDQNLNNKTLFIAYEQTAESQLLFTTLIQRLYTKYPQARLIVETAPEYETFLATSLPQAHVFSCPTLNLNNRIIHMYDAHDFKYDYWLPLGSLIPHMHNLNIPTASCFTADEDKRQVWEAYLKPYANKLTVGIDLQLYPTLPPQYEHWSELLSLDSCKFIALNPHEDQSSFAEIGILPCPYDPDASIDERAACFAELDVVITPFNDHAVLAAGLGTKTIQLTPENDWRMLGEKTSPWFGNAVHILKHTLQQDFDKQITKMAKTCRKILS